MRKVKFNAIKWARDLPTMLHNGRVDRLAHHVVLLVATFANSDGSNATPSVGTLASKAKVSVAELEQVIGRIEALGYLVPAPGSDGRPGWRLDLTKEVDADPVMESRLERKRANTRERMRRLRERQKATGDATVERHVTHESGVTDVTLVRHNKECVTHECDDVTHDCDDVTQQGASQSQVRGGTPPYTSSTSTLLSINAHTPRLVPAPEKPDASRRAETDSGHEPSPLLTVVPDSKPKRKPAKAPVKVPDEYTQEFLAWWQHYPRKDGKWKGFEAFHKTRHAKTGSVSIDALTNGVKRYAADVADREKRHILLPASWLNAKGWMDYEPVPAEQAAASAEDWLRAEWRAGRVKPIEERTGLAYSPPDLPLDVTGADAIDAFYANSCREWIAANHDLIIERLTKRSAS